MSGVNVGLTVPDVHSTQRRSGHLNSYGLWLQAAATMSTIERVGNKSTRRQHACTDLQMWLQQAASPGPVVTRLFGGASEFQSTTRRVLGASKAITVAQLAPDASCAWNGSSLNGAGRVRQERKQPQP